MALTDFAAPASDSEEPDKGPLSKLSNKDLYDRLKRWWREDMDGRGDWAESAEEDYGFVAGEEQQWDPRDIDALKAKFRPIITFNRIQPLVLSVAGEQINNAQEIRFVPREQGDIKPNEVLTSAGEWAREQCDAEDEESEAFWDALICGVGVTETRIDVDTDPEEPNVVIERIDPFEVLWDCNAKKRNLTDARRVWRVRSNIPIDEAEEEYPDVATSDLDAGWAALDSTGKVADQEESKQYNSEFKDARGSEKNDDRTVTQVQCEWWEYQRYFKALDPFAGLQAAQGGLAGPMGAMQASVGPMPPQGAPDGQQPPQASPAPPPGPKFVDLTPEEHDNLSRRVQDLAQAGVIDPSTGLPIRLQAVPLRRKVYMRAFLGRTILKKQKSPCPDRFTFNFITGYRDRNKNQWYGIVRAMKDPQRWANKWLSQALHLMNASAKGGVMAEVSAVENQEQFRKSWAKSDEVTFVEDGVLAANRIQPKPTTPFPAGFYQIMEFAISSIRDVGGVSLEQIGMREATQAASLEYQRKQAGITILAVLFKAMKSYHKNSGRVLLFYIQHYLSDGRLIKIVGQEGAKYVPLVKQADSKYDIIVDEGPTSPNQKERVWSMIGQNFFNLPPEVQMILIDYSPFPSGIVEKVKQAFQQAGQSPAAKMQEQMAAITAELEKMKVQLTQAQAGKTAAETQQIMQEIQNPQGAQNIPPQGQMLIELQKNQTQAELGHEKNSQTYALGREKLAQDQGRAAADAQLSAHGMATEAQLTARRDTFNAALTAQKTKQADATAVKTTLLRELFRPKPEKAKNGASN